MTIKELIPTIKQLNYRDKIQLLQIIINELAQEENIQQKSSLSQWLLLPELEPEEELFERVQDTGREISL